MSKSDEWVVAACCAHTHPEFYSRCILNTSISFTFTFKIQHIQQLNNLYTCVPTTVETVYHLASTCMYVLLCTVVLCTHRLQVFFQ
jgi:hypothetical protein